MLHQASTYQDLGPDYFDKLYTVRSTHRLVKRLSKALLDRITDRAHILETGTESYRFRRTAENIKKGAKRQ